MRKMSIVVMIATAAVIVAFANATPTITTTSPSGVQVGSAAFALTVNGTNFETNSSVRWNGTNRTTTFVSPTRLTIMVPAADITATGTVTVTVFNPALGSGESNGVAFQINNKMNTTTTIYSHAPNPSMQGAAVTVTYAVTATSGTPTGTVTVSDGVTSCSASVAAESCALALTTAGNRTLTATYSGDATFNDSSSSVTHSVIGPLYFPIVGKAPTPTSTSTPTATPTRTSTPAATAIPNPIVNGGFEQGSTGWYAGIQIPYNGSPAGTVLAVSRSQLPSGVTPHSGDWVAWMGGYQNSTTTLQTANPFVVPAGGSTLRYWYWIQSDEPNCDATNLDGAWIFFSTNQQQYTVDSYALCVASRSTGWLKRDLDLSPYVGQSGWLSFVERNIGQNSNWFIDDVQLGTLVGAQFVPATR